MTKTTIFSIGTNLGDRAANLQRALDRLQSQLTVTAVSPVYATAPWGEPNQPEFYNICVAAETDLPPQDILAFIKSIEAEMGRVPSYRWGPRLIDIDLILYGSEVIELPELTVPHPRLAERAFVLVPLADIVPDFVHPVTGRDLASLLAAVDRDGVNRVGDLDNLVNHTEVSPGDRTSTAWPTPFRWGARTYVMGILNVTPDSFSGDGILAGRALPQVVEQALAFAADGADILDMGGASTRPGSVPISAEEEMERVLPALRAVRPLVDLPISVDTYHASVAAAALAAGADWVNDVWGLRMDPDMGRVVAEAGCPVVLMHNRSKPKDVAQEAALGGRYVGVAYDDLLLDVRNELLGSIAIAHAAGIQDEQIILDPGIGFGKTVEQNLLLLDHVGELKSLGYPILIGTSRKSFIGYTLDLPVDQRLEGTAATVSIGIARGADIVRVHDVAAMARVARMTDAIVRRP